MGVPRRRRGLERWSRVPGGRLWELVGTGCSSRCTSGTCSLIRPCGGKRCWKCFEQN